MAEDKVEHIVFKVPAKEVPYVTTKPLHQSQKEINRLEDGSTLFSIDVILNFELERDILGYGENITIISPETLANKIHKRLKNALSKYENIEGD